MNIIESILKNAKRFPDKPAVIFGEDVLTYQALVEQTHKVSYAFNRLGIGQDTFVGLLLTNSIEFVLSMLGAADLGASIAPMSNTLGRKDLLTAIKLIDIKFVVGWHVTMKNIFCNPTI